MTFFFNDKSFSHYHLSQVARVEEIHCGSAILARVTIPMQDKVELVIEGEEDRKLLQDLYTEIDHQKQCKVAEKGELPLQDYDYEVKKVFLQAKRKRDTPLHTPTDTLLNTPKRCKSV